MTSASPARCARRVGVAAKALALAAALLLSTSDGNAAVSRLEAGCARKLGKGVAKLASVHLKRTAKCREREIAGKLASCPDPATQTKIDAASVGIVDAAAKSCASSCSVSPEVACISNRLCPPTGSSAEACTAGAGDRAFDMGRIGFPGPYCEMELDRALVAPADLGVCADTIAIDVAARFADAIYGSTSASSNLTTSARSCLSALSRGAATLVLTTYKAVSGCRNEINRGRRISNPATCLADDAKAAKKVGRAESKLRALAGGRCTDTDVVQLDLCGQGPGQTTTLAQAEDCLVAIARELADSTVPPALRAFSPRSLIDAAYPPAPVCGDGIVNRLPDAFLLVGEECDGADDALCPGQCLPPGDLFECTCASTRRLRFIAEQEGSETDAGWTGLSHDQQAPSRSGFITAMDDCDCDQFIDATCVGSSSDPVCDVRGAQVPTCSWNVGSGVPCDAVGNGNGLDESADCRVCDQFSANAGAFCTDESDCASRCHDADGTPGTACDRQTDCPAGEVCRGRCDTTQLCIKIPNGGPIPVNAAGSAVCAVQTFRTDVAGTRDLVTGEHELAYRVFSRIHLAERLTRPCPVCGGFCEGGANDLEVCKGRCEQGGGPCRFDEDCPAVGSCSPISPDCPGGSCQLSLVCGTDPVSNASVAGKPCRIEYEHAFFGTPSGDCLPSETLNISGRGLEIDYLPATSGTIVLPYAYPCTAPGFELYECPCPDDYGQPSAPNTCAPACDAPGPTFGVGCADGAGSGKGTTCSGGPNAAKICDEDSDCPGAACNANPTHCIGDPAFERVACTTHADCGLGLCVDACPTGRCVPLCRPDAGDPLEGTCAAGPPFYHCDSDRFGGRSCTAAAAAGDCQAICSKSGAPCTSQAECPSSEQCVGPCKSRQDCEAGPDGVLATADDIHGAGACIAGVRRCFLEPIVAEGGSTLNGKGDATDVLTTAAFCAPAAINPGINAGSGFGGPVRVLLRGTNIPNF